jgi:hypothetical protein
VDGGVQTKDVLPEPVANPNDTCSFVLLRNWTGVIFEKLTIPRVSVATIDANALVEYDLQNCTTKSPVATLKADVLVMLATFDACSGR